MSARWLATTAALALAAARPAVATAGSCTVTSVMPVAFGSYDIFDSAPMVSTGAISFECSDAAPSDTVRIDLDGGAARSFAPRTLIGGGFALAYNLYLDAALSRLWGDGTGGSATYGPVAPGDGITTVIVYGKIPAGQNVAAGGYADTVTVTVQY
jgi:spore coat protein U-like protein